MTDRVIVACIFLAVLATAAYLAPACAHEHYPPLCCSDRDCKPVPSSSVKKIGQDWHVQTPDGELVFHPDRVKGPLDDRFHACWLPGTTIELCFFPATGGV